MSTEPNAISYFFIYGSQRVNDEEYNICFIDVKFLFLC